MFLKNRNVISKIKKSKVTDYAALTIGNSNFKLYRCIGHIMLKVLSYILCDLDPKVKVIGKKAGICDGVPSTSALVIPAFFFRKKGYINFVPNSVCRSSVFLFIRVSRFL